jgi:hypothetical protein
VYEPEGWGGLSKFFDSADHALFTPELRKILETLRTLRSARN